MNQNRYMNFQEKLFLYALGHNNDVMYTNINLNCYLPNKQQFCNSTQGKYNCFIHVYLFYLLFIFWIYLMITICHNCHVITKMIAINQLLVIFFQFSSIVKTFCWILSLLDEISIHFCQNLVKFFSILSNLVHSCQIFYESWWWFCQSFDFSRCC